MSQATSDQALSPDERAELHRLVNELGERAAVDRLGVNRATLARALGSLPVRRATVIALRVALTQRRVGGMAP
jgi:hypothetical protein